MDNNLFNLMNIKKYNYNYINYKLNNINNIYFKIYYIIKI